MRKPKKMQAGGYADASDDTSYDEDLDYQDYGPDYGGLSGDEDFTEDPDMGYSSAAGPDDGGGAGYSLDTNAQTLAPFAALQARQQSALQQLEAAKARAVEALQPKQDRSAMWLAIAQGLLSPTRTGGFAESLGNAAGGAAPYQQHYADVENANKAKVADLDYGLAQALYEQSIKNPQIIDWYARNPAGVVGKQKALVIDGQPVPFGEIFTPTGRAGGNTFLDKLNWYANANPEQRAIYDKILAPKANQSVVNVQSNVPYETQDQKNAADLKSDMAKEANKALNLSTQLNAVRPEIEKTPDAYFGPGGPGLVWAGKAMRQLGFDVGEGLDSASFVSAIMSHLGPAQRIVGSGSSSDRDVSLFMNSLPGLTQTKEGNLALIKYYNKMTQFNRKLVKIMNAAADRGDFYGMGDEAQAEIDKLGRIFTDQEESELQRLGQGKTVSSQGKPSKRHVDVDITPEGDLIFNPGAPSQ